MRFEGFRFLEPWWLLLTVLPAAALLVRSMIFQSSAVRFTGREFLADLVVRRGGWFAPLLALLGSTLILVPMAEPRLPAARSTERANVMLVMDVSGSMSASDVAPTRLEAAKTAASQFVVNLPVSWRAGIVAFSERAFLLSAPTEDREALLSSLTSLVAQGGTSTGDALDLAIDAGRAGGQDRVQEAIAQRDALSAPSSTVIVLLSDGAQTSGNIDAATSAERAKTLRIPIYTIALGTDSGVIDIMYPDGEVRPLEVPPDFQAAARVAQTTGGEFFTAVTARELEAVYRSVTEVLEQEDSLKDPSLWMVLTGGMLLLLSTLPSIWAVRPRRERAAPDASRKGTS